MTGLWLVAPTYNEGRALERVILEWSGAVRALEPAFKFLIVDDGSTDETPAILRVLQKDIPELSWVRLERSGHGAACLRGYSEALAAGADWVFQIDSDGQCDPGCFELFWRERAGQDAVYGSRTRRDDGWPRRLASVVLRRAIYFSTGSWVKDANVPYRLMSRKTLEAVLPLIPAEMELANVGVAFLQERMFNVKWIEIPFRKRTLGKSHFRPPVLAKLALRTCRQLRQLKPLANG